jgi:hypothetical protein
MRSVLEFKKQNPQVSIFHLAYEDFGKDTEGCIAKLADFLELPVDETLRRDIARNVSFQKRKTTEEAACSANSLTNAFRMFRIGEADDWKGHMTVAQSEQIDAALQQDAHLSPMIDRYITKHSPPHGDS